MSKKVKIHHSDDATTVVIRGNIRNPEPSTVVVKFPGGSIEVSRCTNGDYWVHAHRYLESNDEVGEEAGVIVASRIDYTPEAYRDRGGDIPPIPAHEHIQHLAIRIQRATQ